MKVNKKNILATIISIIFLVIIFHNIDFKRLIDTFKLFNYNVIFIIVPICILTMILRGIRWKYLLHSKSFSIIELSEVCILGSTINVYLPARAGDFFRAYFLGKRHSLSKLKIFATIVLEKVFDALTTLSILIIAISLYHKTKWGYKISIITGVIFIGSILTLYFLHKFDKTDNICTNLKNFSSKFSEKISRLFCTFVDKVNVCLNSFIGGLESLSNAKSTFYITLLSIIIWGLECVMAYLLIISFGYHVSFSISLFIVSFVAFAVIIPSTSVYIGPYQYAFILALGIYNIDKSQALAIAFTQQIITIIIITLLSLFIMLKNNLHYKNIVIEEIKEVQNAQDT